MGVSRPSQKLLWQRLIAYNEAQGGHQNYYDMRRMLPQWKQEDPRSAAFMRAKE